ncbi:uncharacterized protein LOC118270074 [Spodoptera frugiperda]|uniref:Uncharacterized protein LOC118270074 n=1 Tax=Spodoptera frugiperda TaxID=7108 RepID=A0A9R0F713_SPOFR|nr:uncharacterized protein LOC118270074 [Spodoptera frugiperda]
MATMVKEKRKDKKKSKERASTTRELSPVNIAPPTFEELVYTTESSCEAESSQNVTIESFTEVSYTEQTETNNISIEVIEENRENTEEVYSEQINVESNLNQECLVQSQNIETVKVAEPSLFTKESTVEGAYKELQRKLERMAIPTEVTEAISPERQFELIHPDAYLSTEQQLPESSSEVLEDVMPSAPCFEEVPKMVQREEVFIETKPKVKCMSLEDAIKLCGGKEMEEVRAMSQREEELVEAGPMSGPEHPLVDLLSTFRSSLIAVERERVKLAAGFADEEKRRATLWKIEKRYVNLSEKCQCGLNVDLRASYEYAELNKERLPIAKMRLEGLLRDVQDSYCHHQHAALLAHCQIEELISETIQSNKLVIREALSLVLQALRLSDNAPEALASALQRWAVALSAALVDNRDLRQLLFLIHHLFKQSRSVQWASQVINVHVDSASPWRILAILELLLVRSRTESALECIEECEDAWEEVDEHGGGGAVSEGSLRERDLLALLRTFALRDLVARLVLFTHTDIRQARPQEWGDSTGGRGVVRACGGVRVWLHVLRRAARAHAKYARLLEHLRHLAARTLHALACLHLTSRAFYTPDIEEKISAELEAAFCAGFHLYDGQDLHHLPATLLSDDAAKEYCISLIVGLHDTTPKQLDQLAIELPVLPCDVRVRIISQAAIDRAQDHELARLLLEFLLQTGLKRKSMSCKMQCDAAARECVGTLLATHVYLHTMALHILADLSVVESLDPSCVKTLKVNKWRPSTGEARALLDDWSRRCQALLQHLLLEMDYTPYVGVSLDVQLSIGAWLCEWVRVRSPGSSGGAPPEWCWSVLRRLRPHRTTWRLAPDAPPPDPEPTDLFSTAYALMSSSWGHCIPVICSEGVSGLCRLAGSRPRDAVQCLAGAMLVMAQSPESLAYTPKFAEVISLLLNSGPTLVQRALGRGGVTGADLLLRLILAQLEDSGESRASVLSAWLHVLWGRGPAGACALADAAAAATRDWPVLDAYAAGLLQEENAKEHINQAVRNAGTAPLLCECILRAYHAQYARVHGALCTQLHLQRTANARIHVDNALQKLGTKLTSDELAMYRAAAAALAAPAAHPAHLTLWRLYMHLYLQGPPDYGSVPAVGPLFFSGLIKSRTLAQLKRKLQETITYHHNEGEALKIEHKSIDTSDTQSISRAEKASPSKMEDGLLPALSIVDLTGESSESSDTEDDSRSEKESSPNSEAVDAKRNVYNLIVYHAGAEKMFNEYLSWLEEGDKVRVPPHYADLARFIPEQALEAAWKRAVVRPVPCIEVDSFPLPTAPPAQDAAPPQTPFHVAVDNILRIKDHSRRRRKRSVIKSPVEDVDFKDARTLLSLVDKHLKDIERLAQEWCTEVGRVSSLDGRLWELVSALRVRRALPPVRKQCANKCKHITIYIPEQEWCVSVDAERGVRDNRSSARAALRRLARARPHAARTAAALHTIARRTRSSEAAVRVVERAWRCAGAPHCAACTPASALLHALVSQLAERWICHNGRICAELLGSWGKRSSSSLQQSLCGALLAPRQLPAEAWPLVYMQLLGTQLPSHTLFSYLSKFEMSRWSETADAAQRKEMLDALLRTVQRWGPTPEAEHCMLVELLGLHTAVLLDARELGQHLVTCAGAAVDNKLPAGHWVHLIRAVDAKASAVPFDQLGHILRELGVVWWEARTRVQAGPALQAVQAVQAMHAVHVARLLHALLRAFVHAARALSYTPDRVAWYAWSGLQESWCAWVSPQAGAPPLLPSTADLEAYTPMLRHFLDCVHQVMLDCPGTEIHLLQQIFEWCVQSYMSAQGPGSGGAPGPASGPALQEARVQASALLAEMAKLPWSEHQWFYGKCLQQALQISNHTDRELTSWCTNTWGCARADTLLRGCEPAQLAPHLAQLLYFFTGTLLPHSQQILEEACQLPWRRLPEPALDEALDRFYMVHHNPAVPYHDLPQFKVILVACELSTLQPASSEPLSCLKRARGVSQWVRAACAPALTAHVTAQTAHLLRVMEMLAPHLEESGGELEELMSRAVVIMCIEPAATSALPVWVSWVSSASPRLVRATVSAAAALTAFEYFAVLADTAVRALLLCTEPVGWGEVSSRWQSCPWREGGPLCVRARLHAAYAAALTHTHTPRALHDLLAALLAADIHFVDNEPMIAVWICFACRIAVSLPQDTDEARESCACARSLVSRWAETPRRSILRVVTMHTDTDKPTALHRILCRYAQCVMSPDDNARRNYETACSTTLGANSDVITWAASPQLTKLVRLAIRLWPKYEKYFQHEMKLAPEENNVSV